MKLLAMLLLWALWGTMYWLVVKYASPVTQTAILGITGSAAYFALLSVLFLFPRRKL